MEDKWSSSWKRSETPSKQRKYRRDAPLHHSQKFLSAHLASSVRQKVGSRSIPVREGDKVEMMRGDYSGETGIVDRIDSEEKKIYIDGIERETVGGSETKIPVSPSNVKITKLNLDDGKRLEKYSVSEEEQEDIRVDAEESPDEEEAEQEVDYDSVVDGTIDEVKEAVEERDLDVEQVLEAEESGKDRVTLKEWLQSRGDTDE